MITRSATWCRVIIKLDKEENISKGGIILSTTDETHRKQMGKETGIVSSIGPTAFKGSGSEDEIKVGTRVGFGRYVGRDATLPSDPKGDVYRVMDDEDVMFIIKEE